jgi:hypothetical protein
MNEKEVFRKAIEEDIINKEEIRARVLNARNRPKLKKERIILCVRELLLLRLRCL